jgi:hypothetical protein
MGVRQAGRKISYIETQSIQTPIPANSCEEKKTKSEKKKKHNAVHSKAITYQAATQNSLPERNGRNCYRTGGKRKEKK